MLRYFKYLRIVQYKQFFFNAVTAGVPLGNSPVVVKGEAVLEWKLAGSRMILGRRRQQEKCNFRKKEMINININIHNNQHVKLIICLCVIF